MRQVKKIDSLSPDQERQLVAFRSEWLQRGLSTEPASRTSAEATITDFYRQIGRPAPYFWWSDGVMVSQLAMNLLLRSPAAKKQQPVSEKASNSLRANLWANLGDNLWANLGANLGDNLCANLGANLGANLRDNLGDNLGANLGDNLRDNGLQYFSDYFWGSLEAYWISFYVFPHRYLQMHMPYDPAKAALLDQWADLADSAFWWWPFEGIVFMSERPSAIHKDERTRLHNPNGPAVAFRDGWAVYYWHGVRVPQDVIEQPESITAERIESEQNAEVRRVMIERMGYERYILESGAKLIHSDETGALYRKELPEDEPLVVVHVVNSTEEPDGTFKKYALRVPPDMKTARQAVAWTFGMTEREYAPAIET